MLHHSSMMHATRSKTNRRVVRDRRWPKGLQPKKKEQLGLSIGTATYRLHKLILFRLVQETGRDRCFRCEQRIESSKDLVLDHKVPWLDDAVTLFWDVNNIAFSHARCNMRCIRRGPHNAVSLRKIGPPGTAWCGKHRAFLPASSFRSNRSHWNGLHYVCSPCEWLPKRLLSSDAWAGSLF